MIPLEYVPYRRSCSSPNFIFRSQHFSAGMWSLYLNHTPTPSAWNSTESMSSAVRGYIFLAPSCPERGSAVITQRQRFNIFPNSSALSAGWFDNTSFLSFLSFLSHMTLSPQAGPCTSQMNCLPWILSLNKLLGELKLKHIIMDILISSLTSLWE